MDYCVRKFRGALARQHKKMLNRQIENFDETCFPADVSFIGWHLLIESSTNLDSAVENWTYTLSLIVERQASVRQRRVSERYCSWMTSKLKADIRSRDQLKKSAIKNWSAYRHVRNRGKNLNTSFKKAYFAQKSENFQGNMNEI